MKKATLALVVLVVLAVLAAAVFVAIAMRDRAVFGGEECACGAGLDYGDPYDDPYDNDANKSQGDDTEGWDTFESNIFYGGAGRAFRLAAREPWYSAVVAKKGGVLLRLARPPFTTLAKGDPVQFVRSRPANDMSTHATPRCSATISKIDKYPSFVAAIEAVGLGAVPGAKSAADGAALLYMNRAIDEPAEKEHGVFAITLSDVKPEAPREFTPGPGAGARPSRPPREVGARRVARRKTKPAYGRAEVNYGGGNHMMDPFDKVWMS